MYDVDAIEAINFEQLATVTDRLLLRGRLSKRRPSTNRMVELTRPLGPLARGSQPVIEVPEQTFVTRPRGRSVAAATAVVVSSAVVAFAAVVSLI